MAAVMAQAINIDDEAIQQEQERMASIEAENQGLRELLKISGVPVRTAKEEKASPQQDTDSASSTSTDQ